MEMYCGIDLHSNNGYYSIADKEGKKILGKRLPNDFDKVLQVLEPFRNELKEIAVESSCNWYWLVDGLCKNGYGDIDKIANPAKM